jgi:hypothetical protein
MSWQARIEHTPAGLALTFASPLSRLDMAPDVVAHLASVLAVEARHRLQGVVRALEAENGSHAVLIPTSAHALQCDCDFCLNGDHNAKANE